VIEGWHGDGNFARTSIMYALWKSAGSSIQPWRKDVRLGAVQEGDGLYLSLSAEKEWSGKLFFDIPRHQAVTKLPLDWPRINQFPEWFTVEPGRQYRVEDVDGDTLGPYTGEEMSRGIEVELQPGEVKRLVVRPVP